MALKVAPEYWVYRVYRVYRVYWDKAVLDMREGALEIIQ